MIDAHCHLERHEYDQDREEVIEKCKEELRAIVTCCSHPKDWDLTLELANEHDNFVFVCAGIHPQCVKEISEKDKDDYLDSIVENRDEVVAIGEQGLDYYWTKEREWRKKQRELFIELINFAKDLKKPILVHARDAFEDAVKILEQEDAKGVLMHMFGSRKLLGRIVENDWSISLNAIVLKSKNHKKIARDIPIKKLLVETDAPWLAPGGGRNTPLGVKAVIKKIAKIKKMSFEEVDIKTTKNAIKFFNLKLM